MKRCDEALKLHHFNFFDSVKRFIASISLPALNASKLHCLNFFAVINFSSLHRFPNWPPLPLRFKEKNINA
jgi:hypothetical protein